MQVKGMRPSPIKASPLGLKYSNQQAQVDQTTPTVSPFSSRTVHMRKFDNPLEYEQVQQIQFPCPVN